MPVPQVERHDSKPHAKYEKLIAKAKKVPAAKTIVVHPCDETSLRGAVDAAQAGLIVPILVGPATKIKNVARNTASPSVDMSSSTSPTAMRRPPRPSN